MKYLINYFINRSFIVNLISALLIITGLVSFFSMKRDLIAQFDKKAITIEAHLGGASAKQMEESVTFPIEEVVKNFVGIEEIESYTSLSSSYIQLKVKDEYTDIDALYEKTTNAINSIRSELPDNLENLDIKKEVMDSFWFSSLSILNFKEQNQEHRKFKNKFKDQLLKLSGITQIREWSREPHLFIKLDPQKLSRYQIPLYDIQTKIKSKFNIYPVGKIEKGQTDIAVEINNELKNLDDVRNIILMGNGTGNIIRLKDIAAIEYRLDQEKQRRFTNFKPSLHMHIFKDFDTDNLLLKEDVNKLIEKSKTFAPENIDIQITGDGPAYIERQLNVLKNNGILGIVLVLISLYLFLGLKSSLMTAFGIPLAYFTTFSVLNFLNISIDLISVVGMILILGILVDDAIIVSEQYTQFLEKGEKPKDAAFKAVQNTIGPITGTILTSIVAFVPLMLSKDALSTVLRAIPWVVAVALALSWFECFFILPNHLVHFVKKTKKQENQKTLNKLKEHYAKALSFSLKWRYPVILSLFVFMGFSIWFAKEKIPMKYNLRIGSEKLRIQSVLKTTSGLDETEKHLQPVFNLLKSIDKKRYSYLTANIGRTWMNGTTYEAPRYARIDIRFNQTHPNIKEDKAYILKILKEKLPALKTSQFEHLEVEEKLDGHDEAKDHTFDFRMYLNEEANFGIDEVFEVVKKEAMKIKSTKRVFVDPNLFNNSWSYQFDYRALEEYALNPFDIASQLRGYIAKDKFHEIRYRGRNIKVYTYIAESQNLKFNDLNDLRVVIGQGLTEKLSKFGSWNESRSLKQIKHTNLEQTITAELTFNHKEIKRRDYLEKLKLVAQAVKEKFPSVRFDLLDADKEEVKNRKSINKSVLYCFALILFVLAIVLNSIVQPLLIGMAIPFGIIGVIWAFYFHGIQIDIMAFVGIIGMSGVVVNDSLIMVDTINKLKSSWKTFSSDLIIQGALSRLRPIILTSITTLGGVFPMAYGIGGDSGFTKPLALAMGWGLLLATGLTLFVIPAMLKIQHDIIMFFEKFKSSKNLKIKAIRPLEVKSFAHKNRSLRQSLKTQSNPDKNELNL